MEASVSNRRERAVPSDDGNGRLSVVIASRVTVEVVATGRDSERTDTVACTVDNGVDRGVVPVGLEAGRWTRRKTDDIPKRIHYGAEHGALYRSRGNL